MKSFFWMITKYTQLAYIQVIKKIVCQEKDIIQTGMKISTQNYMLRIGSLFAQSCRDRSWYRPKGRIAIGRWKTASHCSYHMLGPHEHAQLSQIYALRIYICWYVLLMNKKDDAIWKLKCQTYFGSEFCNIWFIYIFLTDY